MAVPDSAGAGVEATPVGASASGGADAWGGFVSTCAASKNAARLPIPASAGTQPGGIFRAERGRADVLSRSLEPVRGEMLRTSQAATPITVTKITRPATEST